MLLAYPRHFWHEAIAEELVTTFEVYAGSSPEPLLIAHHIFGDTGLVLLLAKIYELAVHCKWYANHC